MSGPVVGILYFTAPAALPVSHDHMVEVHPPEPDDLADADWSVLGREIVDTAMLVARTNAPESHRALAEVAIRCTEVEDCVLDLTGLLDIPGGLPGRVWTVPYDMGDGEVGYAHVVDGEFLRAWLGHPDFRMIK